MRVRTYLAWAVALLFAISACGGTDPGSANGGPVDDGSAESSDEGGSTDDSDSSDSPESGDGTATLIVDGQTYMWEENQNTTCDIGGVLPVWVDFASDLDRTKADWVQFIDRGDGGINFSALIGGVEHHGTGSGEADEITSNGFSYTGTMGVDGQQVDVSLEVNC